LNHAVKLLENERYEWVVIVDADQMLPRDFLSRLARVIRSLPSDVAFVQGRHDAIGFGGGREEKEQLTRFQSALGYEVRFFHERDMALRQMGGFLPFLGHGGAISRKGWEAVGGLPEFVSEDYAFALKARMIGYRGVFAESVFSLEGYPIDYVAFEVRLRKFSGGAAELARKLVFPFLKSGVPLVEKYDLLMQLASYFLMPLICLNGFLSAIICHYVWKAELDMLQPTLPYIFFSMLLAGFALIRSVAGSNRTAARYFFWSMATYTASMPATGIEFLRCLVSRPTFSRTPKDINTPSRASGASFATCFLGMIGGWVAIKFWSPFSPILLGQSAAYFAAPLFAHLNRGTVLGTLARVIVLIPGIGYIAGLLAMWQW
jgi:cellulose synthase/poly-beta-1,6-N-acetylglucosamine synthase-like glycosyltransferase